MRSNSNFESKDSNHRIDAIISGLLIGGIFLLMTETPFHVLVRSIVWTITHGYRLIKSTLSSKFQVMIQNLEFSDMVGIILVMISVSLMYERVRERIISNSPNSIYCSDCRHKLHRIHRSRSQRIVSKLLSLSSGYYHCDGCGQSSLHFHKRSMHPT